jgi:hypothetical protein
MGRKIPNSSGSRATDQWRDACSEPPASLDRLGRHQTTETGDELPPPHVASPEAHDHAKCNLNIPQPVTPVCVVPGSEDEKVPLEVDNAIMFSAKELE